MRAVRTPTLLMLVAWAALALAFAFVAPAQAEESRGVDMSLLDIGAPPELPKLSAAEQANVDRLHAMAGEEADAAILEAQRAPLLMETSASAATEASVVQSASVSGQSKWDDSVPDVKLRSVYRPEDRLFEEHELFGHGGVELVSHLPTSRPDLTLPSTNRMGAAFPMHAPAILGEQKRDASFIQQHNAGMAQHQAAAAQMNTAQAAQQQQQQTTQQATAAATTSTHTETAAESRNAALATAKTGAMSMHELRSMMELEGMTAAEIEAYMNSLSHMTLDAQTGASSEQEHESEAESESESESENEHEAESESENESEHENESESEDDVSALETEAESESEAEADSESETESESEVEAEAESEAEAEAEAEEPQTSTPSRVTPIHSNYYQRTHAHSSKAQAGRRVHSALRQVNAAAASAAPGYSTPSFLQTRTTTKVHSTVAHANPAFNPSAIQLGPSHDQMGYRPVSAAEFMNTPSHGPGSAPTPSLAAIQVSMQPVAQQQAWTPPPPTVQMQQPLYVVGIGGLQPNVRTGPHAGVYGIAAGGAQVQAQPQPQPTWY